MNFGSDDVGFWRGKSVETRGERVLFETFLRGKWMVSETFLEVGMDNVDFL